MDGKEFLAQIERLIPWGEWVSLIQPSYYKGERGNKPYDLELMLRIYLLQNLYDLSNESTVEEVIDSRAFSDFCDVDSSNQVPNGDTLGRFRNLLIQHGLQERLFAQVVAMLMERGLILKKGTIVDSTIISAPSSTKNKGNYSDTPSFEAVSTAQNEYSNEFRGIFASCPVYYASLDSFLTFFSGYLNITPAIKP